MKIQKWDKISKNIKWRELTIYKNGEIKMSKIISFDELTRRKQAKIKANSSKCEVKAKNKYIEAWNRLTPEEKKNLQELLEN